MGMTGKKLDDLLKEAREIVRTQPMSPKIAALRDAADQLSESYDILKIKLDRSTLAAFVAAATRTLLAIERIHAGDDPGPVSGAGEKPASEPLEKVAAVR